LRESKIERDFVKYAEGLGCHAYKFIGQKGVPDRLISCPGNLIFFIEFKAPGKGLKSWQEREITRMEGRGHSVYVCDTLPQAKHALIKELLKHEIRTGKVSRNRR
jgi:hypothetical protein